MDQLFEFVNNHLLLWVGLVAVLIMLIKSEYEHQLGRSSQISPMKAIRLMNSEDALVIDVRDVADFKNGHLSNAKNMPFSSLKDKLQGISKYKGKAVLAYCASGAISAKACKLLKQEGFSSVHNITGGINNWLEAKLPVTKK
jgi:rhodanese-related sulfurtransferase